MNAADGNMLIKQKNLTLITLIIATCIGIINENSNKEKSYTYLLFCIPIYFTVFLVNDLE